ncbi:uncharacterized protein LOC130804112 [Amaranthus tricolor]|uniref:uncharacterized protein LOC130804112 n=1 Tax=Amaranthus tricolor TaxID=29722 RepID=UPI002588A72F|nr:uncharacterized protein LOC130804112 [Amaranthus tricolor]
MEGKDGHVYLGLVFLIIGLWHLFNHIKNNITLKSTQSLTWFPTSFSKYLEHYFIQIGCSIFIFSEMIPHSTFDNNGSILATRLHNLEHVSISFSFLFHSLFAILLDKSRSNKKKSLDNINISHFIVSIAFANQLLLFHFHSTDHIGLESQYHLLLQQIVIVCLFTTLLSIWVPKSFMVCYIRSLGIFFQGLWLIIMGYMLWTPNFAPKGCSMKRDDYGRKVIMCSDDDGSLNRGKALVNILFSLVLICVLVFGVGFYLLVGKVYGVDDVMDDDDDDDDGEEMICQNMEDRKRFLYQKSADLEGCYATADANLI